VYVTHDREEALTLADRIAVIDAGRIVQIGAPEEIFHHPSSAFVAGFMGADNALDLVRTATGALTAVGDGVPVEQRIRAHFRSDAAWLAGATAKAPAADGDLVLPVSSHSRFMSGRAIVTGFVPAVPTSGFTRRSA
jgi:ABC-type Fe3+/spermidine/putrescine transport system ATPase subunit